MANPYVLFVLAGIALAAAMWMAVRRPPAKPEPSLRVTWHALRVSLVASSASLAAVCVLVAVGRLQ